MSYLRPQSILFAIERIPHFINFHTRGRVIRSYRELHRNLNRLEDKFARRELKLLAQHSFARYKFITDTSKIEALVNFADTHELKWASLAAQGSLKETFRLLEIAFTTFGVKETPMKHILARPPKVCDHSQVCYRLNNIAMPAVRSFAEHRKAMEYAKMNKFREIKGEYWKITKIMLQNNFKTGKQRRKLQYWPESIIKSELTVFGYPIAESRQANTLKRLYTKFLRDVPRPIHPDALEHIAIQMKSIGISRKYRRRFKELACQMFSVSETGDLRFIDLFASDN